MFPLGVGRVCSSEDVFLVAREGDETTGSLLAEITGFRFKFATCVFGNLSHEPIGLDASHAQFKAHPRVGLSRGVHVRKGGRVAVCVLLFLLGRCSGIFR